MEVTEVNFKKNRTMKKQYNKPSMEAIEIAVRQILCGSGDKMYGDNPQPPGGAMAPQLLFDDDD